MASSSGRTTGAGTAAASQRACLRCIAKKRRCDHERPVCGSCGKLKVSCEYPPPQSRRGPVPGLSKRAEWRVQQCENALWYLLNVPGVTAAVRRAAAASANRSVTNGGAANTSNPANGGGGAPGPGNTTGNGNANASGAGNQANGTSTRAGSAEDSEATLPCAPTSTLDREARAEWWSSHRLDTAGDILEFQRACRQLAGETDSVDEDEDQTVLLPPEVAPEPLAAPAAASSPPAPQPTTPSAIYTPASSSLRNSMGPSLWQLVTAAIPDSDSAGFARELRELRTRRERAVTAAGDADMANPNPNLTTTDVDMAPARENETERERELRRLRQIESDLESQVREHDMRRSSSLSNATTARERDRERLDHLDREHDRDLELFRKREEARNEIALFEAAIAREEEEQREYERRRIRDREEREARVRAAAAAAGGTDAAAAAVAAEGAAGERHNSHINNFINNTHNPATATSDEDEVADRDRFPGLRLPLGVLPNEHLAWTYGAGGMGGVGGAGKRRRLEDMFW